MNMRAKPAMLAVVTAALLALTGVLYWQAARSRAVATNALAKFPAKRTELQRKLEAAQGRLAQMQKKEAGGVDSGLTPKRTPSKSPPTSQSDLIADDPAAEVKMLRWQRAVVALEYGPFFRQHGISQEQIDQFQDNWVKRAEADIDLRAAAKRQDSDGAATVAALQAQSKAENEQATRALLGPETYEQLKEYERTLPVRNILVYGLAGTAAVEGVPLSAQQGEQLWQAALEAAGNDRKANGEALLNSMNWTALDARAQQILTPQQFALFKRSAPPAGFRSRQEYELNEIVRRAREADSAISSGASR